MGICRLECAFSRVSSLLAFSGMVCGHSIPDTRFSINNSRSAYAAEDQTNLVNAVYIGKKVRLV